MSYILISNDDGTSSLVHADNEGVYLAHHGIKGQRWGVRRFQNPDGSLTAAGARRIRTLKGRSEKIDSKKSKLNSARNVAKIAKYKSVSDSKKELASMKKHDEAVFNHKSHSAHTEIGRGSNERKSQKAYKQFKRAIKKSNKLDKKVERFDKKNAKLDSKKERTIRELSRLKMSDAQRLVEKVDERKGKK